MKELQKSFPQTSQRTEFSISHGVLNGMNRKKWESPATIQELDDTLAEQVELRQKDELIELESRCKADSTRLGQMIESVPTREESHRKRMYVLSSLLQVCNELGLAITQKPRFEDEGDRSSGINVRFDSRNRREVQFTLSLEEIEGDSCIPGTHCFEAFSRLSAALSEGFGVETSFRMADGTTPERKARGRTGRTHGREHECVIELGDTMSVCIQNLRMALENKPVMLLSGNVRDRYIDPNDSWEVSSVSSRNSRLTPRNLLETHTPIQ